MVHQSELRDDVETGNDNEAAGSGDKQRKHHVCGDDGDDGRRGSDMGHKQSSENAMGMRIRAEVLQ